MRIQTLLAAFLLAFISGHETATSNVHPDKRGGLASGNVLATCPVRFVASMNKTQFSSMEEILVHLDMSFDGSVLYLEQEDFFHCCYAEVTSPSRSAMELSPSGGDFFNNHTASSSRCYRVAPRFGVNYDFPLSMLYDFSGKGQYHVRFIRWACEPPVFDPSNPPLKPDYSGPIWSNTVTFEIK
jgi:hypothetical protein